MKYNFNELIDRHHTDALKVDGVKSRWGKDDLIPMWVADMDFRTPPYIIERIKKRCEHEILGYTCKPESYFKAIVNWVKMRFGWNITPEMINFSPGIVPGIAFAIKCFTQPGDKIIVQPPVYHPFFQVAEHNQRKVVWNPLKVINGQFQMDMGHLHQIIKGCKLFILCNPHNPGGRVWTKEELKQIAEICFDNQVLVISDEIHADLTLPPCRHLPFATVSEKACMNSITFMSPSKAFNMPGIASAYSIIPNKTIRDRFTGYIEGSELTSGHLFAFITVEAAYSHGTEWLDQVLAYIQENIDYTENYLKKYIPQIGMIRPQASYLIFLDCRKLELAQENLVDLFVEDAGLALNDGSMFGPGGTGFMRINVACPRCILEKALSQLGKAVQKYQK